MSLWIQPEIPLWADTSSRTALSVGQLTRHLAAVLAADAILQDVWVRGEVSKVTYHTSGHIYFDMKDAEASLRCVIWRSDARALAFTLEAGMQLLAHGRLALYERRGDYQLVVDTAEPDGLGALYLAFEQLKARLEAEGLFTLERKRPIPSFPRRVAVVTSPTGAVLHDISAIVRRRSPATTLIVAPAQVQGDGAPESIARAIAAANEGARAEVLLLARGGGSIEDLWAFNDERVVRAIVGSRLPVISAVGHETDVTLADFAADLRAPTPSAAAELVAPDAAELLRRVAQAQERLLIALEGRIDAGRQRLEKLRARRPFLRPIEPVERRRQELDDLRDRLLAGMERARERCEQRLSALAGRLWALSPLSVLARGYAVVTREPEGTPVRARADAGPGDRLRIRLRDGDLLARVVAPEEPETQREEIQA